MAGVDTPWEEWVAPSRTRNFCADDPLLDWLETFGEAHGFRPDDRAGTYDPRTDFRQFIFRKAVEFEAAVMAHLSRELQIVSIRQKPEDTRDRRFVEATWRAMRDGAEAIAQGVLWNAETSTYGAPDLLVRSDVLRRLFPSCLSELAACERARDLTLGTRHYRVVDIKFTTLDLLVDGRVGSSHLEHMTQVWLYNEALGRLQGFTPDAGFLLGRRWTCGEARGHSALDRLARVDRAGGARANGDDVSTYATGACHWLRRLRKHGASWEALPTPSVPELRPNMRHHEDGRWHGAKARIAAALDDLTLLPRVTPERRMTAFASGLSRWTDPACCAATLGVTGTTHAALLDAVIQANHSPSDGPIVFPARVTAGEELWRVPVRSEFFVDFETVSDLDEDFSTFPEAGSQPIIFMIGCGHFIDSAEGPVWTFRVFTVKTLSSAEERRVIDEWLAYMTSVCGSAGQALDQARVFHWSPAEKSNFEAAYNAARVRHDNPPWPAIPWVDLLNRVVKAEPVTVRGAFAFGLKPIARAMQTEGLVSTLWQDNATDGLGAMVGAWWCHSEAARLGIEMGNVDLMRGIEAYNEVDCKVMAEVLAYLRKHR